MESKKNWKTTNSMWWKKELIRVQASQRLCDTQVKNTDPGIRSLDSRPAETLITFMICV